MSSQERPGRIADSCASPTGRYRTSLLAIAAACAVAGLLAFTIDLPVARWCARRPSPLPGDLLKLLNLAEVFAHGVGVAALVATLLVSDPALALPLPGRPAGARGNFLRLAGAAAVGGLLADLVKACVERVRPNSADLAHLESAFGTFGSDALSAPLTHAAQIMSFPSGHAAAAAGLAAALGWKYPHGRPAFATLAVLSAAQRVATSAHYPSDVCFGAAVGLVAAAVLVGGGQPWTRSVARADGT
ncbi:MAG: phosphatase PAP2 family protein [Planctomycetaceae bacterium]